MIFLALVFLRNLPPVKLSFFESVIASLISIRCVLNAYLVVNGDCLLHRAGFLCAFSVHVDEVRLHRG